MEIRKIQEGEYKDCEKILRSLPNWFGIEESIVEYVKDIQKMDTYIAEENNSIIGFITINKHNEFTGEIHVMGILPEYHRKGIGRKLVSFSENLLRKENFEFFEVKTLSNSSPDKFYEKTRNFYFSMGFRPMEEMKELWGKSNPCLIMIKSIK